MTNRFLRRDIAYAICAVVTAVAGYLVFRAMYFAGEPAPFAQEMVLVFLGAVATIYLTAALLNRQTELELRKEGRVIVLQQKAEIYMACVEKVAELVERRDFDPRLVDELRVLTHKLAIVGSRQSVEKFRSVLERLLEGLRDGGMTDAEGASVMEAVADLTAAMREDILQEIGLEGGGEILDAIRRNSRRMEALDDIECAAEAQPS